MKVLETKKRQKNSAGSVDTHGVSTDMRKREPSGDGSLSYLVLPHHQQGSCRDQDRAQDGFGGKFLMQEHNRQDHGEDHAEFVHRYNFGNVADLQGTVVAQPGRAGGKAGQDQENPAAGGDRTEPVRGGG